MSRPAPIIVRGSRSGLVALSGLVVAAALQLSLLSNAKADPALPAPTAAAAESAARPASPAGDDTGSQQATSGPTAGEGRAPAGSPETSDGAAASGTRPASPPPSTITDEAAAIGTAVSAAREAKPLPAIADEAQGTCRSPRQAWLQLLYWLQKGENRWDPARAAACMDTSRLKNPDDANELAARLKEVIDSRNARIDIDGLPTNPDYLDNSSGLSRYWEPTVRERVSARIFLVRKGERWLFSTDTLDAVPDLYPSVIGAVERALPGWAKQLILGVELWKYFAVLLLLFVAMMVQRFVVFVIRRYLRRLAGATNSTYLNMATERADRPIGGLAVAVVFHFGFPLLLFPLKVAEAATVMTEALAAFSGVWLGYRMIDVLAEFMRSRAAATESKLDDQLVPMVAKTLKVFVVIIGALFILQNLDVNVGSLLAGLGLGGLAFALAAKDTIANFFGSLMIFIDKPFQIGDWVVLSGTEGIIEEVGFRTSRVRTFYNSLVTVPNALVTNSIVDNYGARRFRRYSTTLGLCYDTPPDKVAAFCEGARAVIAAMPEMRKDYYIVEFKDFGASSLNIMVYCFVVAENWNVEMRVRTRLNLEFLRLAATLGVGFAFPTQTLHIESMVEPGGSRPTHQGPQSPAELAGVIDGFGPGGGLARPQGPKISEGYDNSPKWAAPQDPSPG